MAEVDGYWGEGYYGEGYWGEGYWGEYGAAPATPVPKGSSSIRREYYDYPHIRTEPELTSEEKPILEVIDYSGWTLPDLLRLLAEMKPTGSTLDDVTHRVKQIIHGRPVEIVADPFINLRIMLKNIPRRDRWSKEKELKNIIVTLLDEYRNVKNTYN